MSRPVPLTTDEVSLSEHNPVYVSATSTNRGGRYSRLIPDRHPTIPNLTSLLLLSTTRPGRLQNRRQLDSHGTASFGDAIIYKATGSMRIFFQNVKGLTFSTGVEDYRYYASQMAAYSVDCFGLVETNTAWQHYYLQLKYRDCVQRQFRTGKTVFGFPSKTVDLCTDKK